MFIYYQTNNGNILMRLREDDRWYLISDLDAAGMAHLYIHINGNESLLLSRTDLSARFSEMDDEKALTYFNGLIYEAFLMLKAGKDYIDMYEIEADLLPFYLDAGEDVFVDHNENLPKY